MKCNGCLQPEAENERKMNENREKSEVGTQLKYGQIIQVIWNDIITDYLIKIYDIVIDTDCNFLSKMSPI